MTNDSLTTNGSGALFTGIRARLAMVADFLAETSRQCAVRARPSGSLGSPTHSSCV